tara:strand:+ start:694 stop:1035 length:342 start_codon:yes stop_codon:yes gene_type:complete
MDLYEKVEKVINDYVIEHKEEVRKGKELLSKLDLIRFNEHTRISPPQDYSFSLNQTGEKSKWWYEYDRNDLNRPNPFKTYTITSGASSYDPKYGYRYSPEAQGTWYDYTELPE